MLAVSSQLFFFHYLLSCLGSRSSRSSDAHVSGDGEPGEWELPVDETTSSSPPLPPPPISARDVWISFYLYRDLCEQGEASGLHLLSWPGCRGWERARDLPEMVWTTRWMG